MSATTKPGVLAPPSSQAILDYSELAYLDQMVAEIVAKGNPRGDLLVELERAHKRRWDFAIKIINRETEGFVEARKAMSGRVYDSLNERAAFAHVQDGAA